MSDFWKERKIYISIVSAHYSWEKLLREASGLELKEVAFFFTGTDRNERKKVYEALENSSVKSIPFVHLRSDTEVEEIDYLIDKFKTKKFNIHPESGSYPMENDISKYKDMVYVENAHDFWNGVIFGKEDVVDWAGVCVDVAHLVIEEHLYKENYEKTLKVIKESKAGCNHISPFKMEQEDVGKAHFLEDFSELDYLKECPAYVFSDTMALEMTNSVKEQLKAREYIIDLLKDKE